MQFSSSCSSDLTNRRFRIIHDNPVPYFLVHYRDDATPFSSEFMYDVAKRNKIPFSGITTNVHLNCRVDITNVITDLSAYPGILHVFILFLETNSFHNTWSLILLPFASFVIEWTLKARSDFFQRGFY